MAMVMLDTIVDLYMRPGYPFAGHDRAVIRAMVEAQFAGGRYVLLVEDGRFQAFLSWLRTDERGAGLIRDYGLIDLAFLALPIAGGGEWVVVVFNVISPAAPQGTIFRLKQILQAQNRDAVWVATVISTRRGHQWAVRRL